MSEAVTPNPVLTGGICTPASIEVGTRSNPTATYPPLAIEMVLHYLPLL